MNAVPEKFKERPLTSEERAAKAQIMEHLKRVDHNSYEAVMRAERDGRKY